MNPLDAFRTDIQYADPLARARRLGELDDARTERQAELSRYDAADRSAGLAQQQLAEERAQVAARGYSDRELAEHQRAITDARTERIAELEAELERLDPNRRATAKRTQSDIDAAALLQRAREVGNSPFMHRMVAELEQRDELRRAERAQHQMARAEQELSRQGY